MIVVRVELHSAITGKVTEIARMDIANEGGNQTRGDYGVYVMRGRDKETLAKRAVQRTGKVLNHARDAEHVWSLVHKALHATGYTILKETS